MRFVQLKLIKSSSAVIKSNAASQVSVLADFASSDPKALILDSFEGDVDSECSAFDTTWWLENVDHDSAKCGSSFFNLNHN